MEVARQLLLALGDAARTNLLTRRQSLMGETPRRSTVTFSHGKIRSYDIEIIFIRFIGTHQEYDNVTSSLELETSSLELETLALELETLALELETSALVLETSGLKMNSTRSKSKRWS
ncbi:type II toxin-antitoxin system HigB family toxin [Nostoc sp. XA010]|uniref:type II toxin-antitoxin system HigB family toxin n=1 Tax=Nostoc sp. XA010 TaxID=2780407 RepID=UPI001E53B1A0|nr:type II toxin-antitoxin system HigB family toxin [Nostoc sp. XA010]MCC5658783.1 type II toxin-antitoxin system HigB family toxin [Nostoc sp. XA010]